MVIPLPSWLKASSLESCTTDGGEIKEIDGYGLPRPQEDAVKAARADARRETAYLVVQRATASLPHILMLG